MLSTPRFVFLIISIFFFPQYGVTGSEYDDVEKVNSELSNELFEVLEAREPNRSPAILANPTMPVIIPEDNDILFPSSMKFGDSVSEIDTN